MEIKYEFDSIQGGDYWFAYTRVTATPDDPKMGTAIIKLQIPIARPTAPIQDVVAEALTKTRALITESAFHF